MARGREEKKSKQEVFAIREAEMKSGQLITPGLTMQIYYGPKNSV
jgi:hypothetical protein